MSCIEATSTKVQMKAVCEPIVSLARCSEFLSKLTLLGSIAILPGERPVRDHDVEVFAETDCNTDNINFKDRDRSPVFKPQIRPLLAPSPLPPSPAADTASPPADIRLLSCRAFDDLPRLSLTPLMILLHVFQHGGLRAAGEAAAADSGKGEAVVAGRIMKGGLGVGSFHGGLGLRLGERELGGRECEKGGGNVTGGIDR